MARAACVLLAIMCISAVWLSCMQADEMQARPVAERGTLGRLLKQWVPTEITYSIENGLDTKYAPIKFKSVTTHTKKKAEEEEEEEEDEKEEVHIIEKDSVGAHAAAFREKEFVRKEPLKVEKIYEQKVTIDHNNLPPVVHDVILEEKPSVAIKVTAEHEKDVKVTATKDR